PALLLCASIAAIVAAAWTIRRRPRTGLAFAAASWLVLLATPLATPRSQEPSLVVFDVGHGLCVLAHCGDTDVLFDAGGPTTAIVPGDIEGAPFVALAADPTVPPARVLLLPHHGRGDPAEHLALARRAAAEILVASTSASAPMSVPGALVTGTLGAVRIRPGA